MVMVKEGEVYEWLPGQAYDPVRGLDRTRKEPQPGVPAPLCSCKKPRHLSKRTGRYAATCLSLACLQSLLNTNKREKGKEAAKVEKLTPSDELAGELERLLARPDKR